MRLRTKVSCAIIGGFGVSSLAAFTAGCISDDNASPETGDSGVDATMNAPETSSPSDTGTDSTEPSDDAGVDAAQDAGDSAVAVVDTSVDAGCAPALPNGWQPPAYVPAQTPHLHDCVGSQVDNYWTACFGDASTPAVCAAYSEAGAQPAGCATCLVTPEAVSPYGPEILGVVPEPNVAGCIQQTDLTDAGFSCAVAVQAAQMCAEAACKPSCAVTADPATVAAYVACAKAAATSVCNALATTALGCLAVELDAGSNAATTCLSGTTDEETFDDIGMFFCHS
jgi:hypothetical protein